MTEQGIYESRILIVDDEPEMREMVSSILEEDGYHQIDIAGDAVMADFLCQNKEYHLILLDVMMPGMSGFDLFEAWNRNHVDVPVIFLSARDKDKDRLKGLGLGADDYIGKPFLPQELLLRVRAVLKRTRKIEEELSEIMIGKTRVHMGEGIVYKNGQEIPLTAKELLLLQIFIENRGRIIQTSTLMDYLWPDGSYGLENSLMVHIRRIREKIEEQPSSPQYIQTIRGLGYRLKKEKRKL